MSFSFAGVFAGAGQIWRRERELLLGVAGVFFLLPLLAVRLFVPPMDAGGAEGEALTRSFALWLQANGHWLALQLIVQAWGSATLLLVLLAPDRPTVSRALVRGLMLLPGFLLAWIATSLMVMAGAALFFAPGFYALGRTFLVWPRLAVAPRQGPMRALVDGVRQSRGRGWILAAVPLAVLGVSYLLVAVLDGIGHPPGVTTSPLLGGIFDVLVAAAGAASALGQLLLQVSAYRLTAPSKGI